MHACAPAFVPMPLDPPPSAREGTGGAELTAAALPDDQSVRDDDVAGRRGPVAVESFAEELQRPSGDRPLVGGDGGERRARVAPVLDVVEADDGDVAGDVQATLVRSSHGAQRELVVEA